MKPILYAANETNFDTQGLGALYDCISAVVTEERNGMYELRIVYPVTGQHFSEITHSCIIKALPFENGTLQLFRVYSISEPINGHCTINADHISYQLNYIPCMPFTAENVADALSGLANNAVEDCPFSFSTDMSTVAHYEQEVPEAIRSRLGGQSGSILDIYGGEYEFNNYAVSLKQNRGTDRSVTLRYGKNITDITQEENIEKTITGVMPYWIHTESDGETETTVLVTLDEKVIHSDAAENFPFQRTTTLDLSQEFEEQPTQAELRAKAEKYMELNNIGIPSVSIEVSFVALWGTEEYKSIAPLERVSLCDTVGVIFEPLGIQATAKVVKTVFDVLNERYNSVNLGDAKSNFSSTITEIEQGITDEIEKLPTDSEVSERVSNAINKVTGAYGGTILYGRDANGKPEELYIIDTDDIATATSVIRMNRNGIAFSKNGFEGPYITAWTIDGEFVADFIATGTLESQNGKSSINMQTGEATFENLTISSPYWELDDDGSFSLGGGALNYHGGDNYIYLGRSTAFMLGGVSLAGEDVTSNLYTQDFYDFHLSKRGNLVMRYPFFTIVCLHFFADKKNAYGNICSGFPYITKKLVAEGQEADGYAAIEGILGWIHGAKKYLPLELAVVGRYRTDSPNYSCHLRVDFENTVTFADGAEISVTFIYPSTNSLE